jgi:hypothetical protein
MLAVVVNGQSPTPTPKPSSQELKPFDTSQENLPPNYHGFDASVIDRALRDKKKRLQKDEFETTETYIRRKKEEESRPFIGSVKIDSKIAFEIFIDSLAYDADRQIMEVHPYNSILGLQLVSPYSYIAVGSSDKWEIKMDSLTAKQAKPHIRALAVVTLIEPYFREHSHTVFTVQLHEIWFYHETTGKIFHKLKSPKTLKR